MTELPAGIPRLSALSFEELRAEILTRVKAYPVSRDPATVVERALAYPFEPPPFSYFLIGRSPLPILSFDHDYPGRSQVLAADRRMSAEAASDHLGVDPAALDERRHPVLAYGSNSSPQALAAKFARSLADAEHTAVPVLLGGLRDFDVVYSAHVSAYGSIPAALHPSPGTTLRTYVTLLSDAQLVCVCETEFNYSLQSLGGIRFAGERYACGEAIAFVSRHGAIEEQGEAVPLAAVGAEGRRGRVSSQREAQELVRDRHAPGEAVEDFILANVRDPERSGAITRGLREQGLPFDYAGASVLDS